CVPSPTGWGCWRPARATTTGPARWTTTWGATRPRPRCTQRSCDGSLPGGAEPGARPAFGEARTAIDPPRGWVDQRCRGPGGTQPSVPDCGEAVAEAEPEPDAAPEPRPRRRRRRLRRGAPPALPSAVRCAVASPGAVVTPTPLRVRRR